LESLDAGAFGGGHTFHDARGDDDCARELCALSRRGDECKADLGWTRLQFPDYHCEHREHRVPRDRRAEGTIVSFANDVSESDVPLVGFQGETLNGLGSFRGDICR